MKSKSPFIHALTQLFKSRLVLLCFLIVVIYFIIACLSFLNLLPSYETRLGESFLPPSKDFLMGTDFLGRSVLAKVLYGSQVALSVGLIASAIAIPIGVVLGLIAGYFGKYVDDIIVWLYCTVDSIPQILLLLSISFVMGRGMTAIYVAVGLTSWVSICRMIRAEVMKHREKEYVLAAKVLGASDTRIILKHILPNVFHLVIIDFSLRFIYAIKSEAILSYLGLGIQGKPSWGIMIADAKGELLQGKWWQLAAATGAMFFLVLALNIVGDALRDALDPKTKSNV